MANQAWQITAPGQLTLKDLGPPSKPGLQEALVRIHAASLNYRDVLVVDHNPNYPVIAKQDLVPCSDGSGVVEESGPDSVWKKGDRVVVQPSTWFYGTDERDFDMEATLGGGTADGVLRRYMVASDERLFRVPAGLSFEEAATMWTAGVTAYRSLYYSGVKMGPGTNVLTQGTGGVSCYAIMVAAAAGATVIATSSSDEKLNVAHQLGATHLINYRTNPDWEAKVLELTENKGVDLTVEVVGAESIEQTLKCTTFGGVVSLVGVLSKNQTKPVNIMNAILFGGKKILGQLGAGSRQMGNELAAMMEKHQLHPPIAQMFDFEDARKALKALTDLNAVGKIVVRC